MNKPRAVLDERIMGYLGQTTIIRLATITPAGLPHVAPFWFAANRDRIVISTLANQTVRNLTANRECALLVDLGTDFRDLRGALIHGQARVWRDGDDVPTEVRTLHDQIERVHAHELTEPEFERYDSWETRDHIYLEIVPRAATWFDLGLAAMGRTGQGSGRPIGPAAS
ncbi:MAG TPA: pyridoxamine 5'-phosphate oxidase family protein [Candidatus Limnocylindrales bacterium]|jgi:nitroimidazol reductase NimA-like FMN-containing flavoprotein (pyridoxamine 5'-phosphate oxidase superfamily)|nr:pyridoxamine 5'-phosphate oxidase family protein [Candidatus Limnocylindrales bacterium]